MSAFILLTCFFEMIQLYKPYTKLCQDLCHSLLINQSINQLINQFIYANTWDGVAPFIRARGSCMKRMRIKIVNNNTIYFNNNNFKRS